MFGAVAAGSRVGGYDTIFEAARHMARLKDEVYQPIPVNQKIYDRLYAEYVHLHMRAGRFGEGVDRLVVVVVGVERLEVEVGHGGLPCCRLVRGAYPARSRCFRL